MSPVANGWQELQAEGYNVGKLPEEEGDLIKSVLNDTEVRPKGSMTM